MNTHLKQAIQEKSNLSAANIKVTRIREKKKPLQNDFEQKCLYVTASNEMHIKEILTQGSET